MQTKKDSILESAANTAISLGVNWLFQMWFVVPVLHVKMSAVQGAGLVLTSTFAGLFRQYVLRRFFEYRASRTMRARGKQGRRELGKE